MAALNGNSLEWLLQKSNPLVRYRTLREILDRPEDDPDVVEAKEAIWDYPPVRALMELLQQTPVFNRNTPLDEAFRQAWNARASTRDLDTLFRFSVPGGHPAIEYACEQWLNTEPTFEPSCYPEQMIGGLIRYTNIDDPRLQKKIKFVIRNQPFFAGNRPGVLRYGGRGSCCGSHSCFYSVARSLWAIAGVPEKKRTPEVRDFLRGGRDFLAAHRVYKSDHKGYKPIQKYWLKLHLPFALGWRTDVLDLLDVATQIGLADDPSIADALQFLISKQNHRGRWQVEETLRIYKYLLAARVQNVEPAGQESKWITLAALKVFKRSEKLVARICRGEKMEQPAEPPPSPRFASYPFAYDPEDEERVKAEWKSFGMGTVLEKLLKFASANGLMVGWHWGFVMGPENCPEWCAAIVRWVPAKNMKNKWIVCRIFFMVKRGQFAVKEISRRLRIPIMDEYPGKRKKGNWLEQTLWRIKSSKWKGDLEEIAVTLRDSKGFASLRGMMSEALRGLEDDRTR